MISDDRLANPTFFYEYQLEKQTETGLWLSPMKNCHTDVSL